MTKIQKLKIILVACVLSFVVAPVFAAELFFEAKTTRVQIGETFEVKLFVNSEQESINAFEGKIAFSGDILDLKEIRDGNSIINFWIERPKSSNGEILFSGITPGGYLGKKGLIFSVVFQSIQEGRGSIEIRDIKTLLNDGKGTEADTTISNLQFVISKQALPPQPTAVEKKDTNMPEAFEPTVASDPAIFDGKYFLVFSAQDKDSGIAGYAIHENTWKKEITQIDTKRWVEAESPYLLKDQKLRSYIYVKAIDKSGNERVVILPPQKPLPWYKDYWIIGILIIVGLVIAGLFLRKFLWQKFIKSR